MMLRDELYRKAFKCLVAIVLSIVLARVTHGAFCVVIVLIGCCAALTNRAGLGVCTYVLLPFMLMFSGYLLPKEGMVWSLSLRVGTLLVSLCLMLGSMRRSGRHRLPLGGLVIYLMVAAASSAQGWSPWVSYLKLINFFVFILGLWYGTQNLQRYPEDIKLIRSFFFALVALTILGSVFLMPFPSISYATSLRHITVAEGTDAADAMYREMIAAGNQTLFCGIMSHSQALSPTLAICLGWLLCDMLFVERKIKGFHGMLIVLSLPLLFKTRSRVALLTLGAILVMVYFYAMKKVEVPARVKRRLNSALYGFLMVAVVVSIGLEMKDHTMTRWIRKTQDVEGDRRSLSEAVTSSRQGTIEANMADFYRNPMLGSGFQVTPYMQNAGGFILSAPVEKGVLPVMILGESGIVGAIVFAIFLLLFYAAARRRRLYVTATLFTILLVTNLGEATFFSPGGIGALLWALAAVGGFAMDTIIVFRTGNRMVSYNGRSYA